MDENLTPEEETQEERTGIDGEEEHRYAEFEDIRDRLERLTELVQSVVDWTAGADSAMVQNGEIVTDDAPVSVDIDGDGDTDFVDMTPDIDGDDLQLD